MKVCIPKGNNKGMEGIIDQHFGKALTYKITDTKWLCDRKLEQSHGGRGTVSLIFHKTGLIIMPVEKSGIKRFTGLSLMESGFS